MQFSPVSQSELLAVDAGKGVADAFKWAAAGFGLGASVGTPFGGVGGAIGGAIGAVIGFLAGLFS
jgi:hypothetical protein